MTATTCPRGVAAAGFALAASAALFCSDKSKKQQMTANQPRHNKKKNYLDTKTIFCVVYLVPQTGKRTFFAYLFKGPQTDFNTCHTD